MGPGSRRLIRDGSSVKASQLSSFCGRLERRALRRLWQLTADGAAEQRGVSLHCSLRKHTLLYPLLDAVGAQDCASDPLLGCCVDVLPRQCDFFFLDCINCVENFVLALKKKKRTEISKYSDQHNSHHYHHSTHLSDV